MTRSKRKRQRCYRCKVVKLAKAFNANNTRPGGLQFMCKECARAYNQTPARRAAWKAHNATPAGKAAKRRHYLKYEYGLTQEGYDRLFAAQGGLCRLPRCMAEATDVDHDHSKQRGDIGSVRGLLCRNHNHALGHFKDDPAYLADAIAYLRGELPPLNVVGAKPQKKRPRMGPRKRRKTKS